MNGLPISWAGGPELGLYEAIVLLKNLGVALLSLVAVARAGRVAVIDVARLRRVRVRVEVSI
jgi:hypothetical protein